MLTLAALCAATASAQGPLGGDFPIPPTPTPIGAGARAAGMGNAFVAIADDATAASWNPAGLVQLERPELSIVGEYNWREDDAYSSVHPEFGTTNSYEVTDLNYLSFVYPLPVLVLGRNAVASLNYQRRYDFRRQFKAPIRDTVSLGNSGLLLRQLGKFSFDQDGSLSTISPAFAIELTHRLSAGVAVNFWRDSWLSDNGWRQETRLRNTTFLSSGGLLRGSSFSSEEYRSVKGQNLTLGLLWSLNDRWNLGLRYDSSFTARADYAARDRTIGLSRGALPVVNSTYIEEQREIHFPDTWALGLSYRANDRLTLALDISRTEWDSFWVKTEEGRRVSLISGLRRAGVTKTDFDPAYQVRLGAEYVLLPEQPGETLPMLWTLRVGLSYEEEPATARSTRQFFSRGNGEVDRFYGMSAGAGVLLGQRVNLDFAYQLRYGPGVNRDASAGVPGFDSDETQQRLVFSTVVYF